MASRTFQHHGSSRRHIGDTLSAASQHGGDAVVATRDVEPRAAQGRVCRQPGDPAYLAMIERLCSRTLPLDLNRERLPPAPVLPGEGVYNAGHR